VNTFTSSVEGRTRTHQPFQRVYLRPSPSDESFECELPAEVLARLPEKIPPSQTYRIREIRTYRPAPPPLAPEVVIGPSPPPESGAGKRAQNAPSESGAGIWLLLAVLLGCPMLLALLAHAISTLEGPFNRPVEVRRALPPPSVEEVRRALPADTGSPAEVGTQRMVTIPDGGPVSTTFKGYLSDVSQLPVHGGQMGDMWAIGNNYWILTTVPGSFRQGWVDPPGDGVEVRRALPIGDAAVRRAKLVAPRAELLRLPGN
jgi:hypothetical protein